MIAVRPIRLADLRAVPFRPIAEGTFVPAGPRYDPRSLRKWPVRALRGGPDGLVASFAVRSTGIAITVLARGVATDEDATWAMATARGLAAVDDDPSEALAMAKGHPVLGRLAGRFDCRLPKTPTVFESFARAVIEQLVTTWEAKGAIRRLFGHTGALVDGTRLRAAPTPQAVLGVAPWKLHAFGIGSRRGRTLREGARRGAALERLRTSPPEVATEKIQSLPGVGPWTANYVAKAAFGWSDAVPVRDFHAHTLVTEALTGEAGDDDRMLEVLEPFRPHRARIVMLLSKAYVFASLAGVTQRPPPRIDPHRREPWKY